MTFLFTVALACLNVGPDESAPHHIVVSGGRVLHPSGDRWLEGHDVLISDGRIVSVAPPGSAEIPESARRVDAAERYLIPGLIDLHSHLLLHPYDEATWNDQVLKESIGLRTIRGVKGAEATVRNGFTTLRDLGTEGAGYADVGLRDAIRLGLIAGPRVFAVTRALVATGCYGPSGFDPRWKLPVGAQVADGPVGVRQGHASSFPRTRESTTGKSTVDSRFRGNDESIEAPSCRSSFGV